MPGTGDEVDPPRRCPWWPAHRHHQPHVGVVLSGRIAPINLRIHADQVLHSRRPTSALMRNRFYLFYISFFSSSIYLWGTPRGPIPQPDRSPRFVRDFRLLIPAHGGRRLHDRLDG